MGTGVKPRPGSSRARSAGRAAIGSHDPGQSPLRHVQAFAESHDPGTVTSSLRSVDIPAPNSTPRDNRTLSRLGGQNGSKSNILPGFSSVSQETAARPGFARRPGRVRRPGGSGQGPRPTPGRRRGCRRRAQQRVRQNDDLRRIRRTLQPEQQRQQRVATGLIILAECAFVHDLISHRRTGSRQYPAPR